MTSSLSRARLPFAANRGALTLLFARAEGGNSHLRVAFVGVALCASGQMCRQTPRWSVCGDGGPAIEFTLTGGRQGFRAFGEEMGHIRLREGQGMGTPGNGPIFQKATAKEREFLQRDRVSVQQGCVNAHGKARARTILRHAVKSENAESRGLAIIFEKVFHFSS